MPTAPRAERRVLDAPVPGVRVSAAPTEDTYGGQIGDTVARAAVRMYDLQTRSSDNAAVVEAETKANDEQLRIQQEIRAFRGKEAANAPEYGREQWSKVHEQILGSLANDRQRAMFHSIALQKGEIINRGALAHFNEEDERFQQETFKANIASSINVARANAESPVAVAFEKDLQKQRIDEHAAKYGYTGTPRYDEALTTVQSATNTAVIQGLLDKGQDLRAKAYYDQIIKDEKANPGKLQFTAEQRGVVDKALLAGSTSGESRRQAQSLIATHGIETVEQRRNILKAIDNISDVKVADLTRQRVEHAISQFDELKRDDANQTFLRGSQAVEEAFKQNDSRLPRDLISSRDWNKLTPDAQHALEVKFSRLRNPDKSHDGAIWLKGQLLSNDALAALTPEQITSDYLNHFDDKHADRFIEDVKQARTAQVKAEAKDTSLSPLSLKDQIMNGWIDSRLAKDPKKLQGDEVLWYNLYETEANKALRLLPKTAQQADIDATINGVKDRLLKQKVTVPGFFGMMLGGKDVPVAAYLQPKFSDISGVRREELRKALEKTGIPVTDDNIQALEAKSRQRKLGVQ